MRNLDQQVVDASGERSGFMGVRAKHEAFLGKSCASCSIYLIQERVLEKTMALASLSQTLEPKCHTKDPHTHCCRKSSLERNSQPFPHRPSRACEHMNARTLPPLPSSYHFNLVVFSHKGIPAIWPRDGARGYLGGQGKQGARREEEKRRRNKKRLTGTRKGLVCDR